MGKILTILNSMWLRSVNIFLVISIDLYA